MIGHRPWKVYVEGQERRRDDKEPLVVRPALRLGSHMKRFMWSNARVLGREPHRALRVRQERYFPCEGVVQGLIPAGTLLEAVA